MVSENDDIPCAVDCTLAGECDTCEGDGSYALSGCGGCGRHHLCVVRDRRGPREWWRILQRASGGAYAGEEVTPAGRVVTAMGVTLSPLPSADDIERERACRRALRESLFFGIAISDHQRAVVSRLTLDERIADSKRRREAGPPF